jgi:hypothetical protein
MSLPLRITFRELDHSDAVEALVRRLLSAVAPAVATATVLAGCGGALTIGASPDQPPARVTTPALAFASETLPSPSPVATPPIRPAPTWSQIYERYLAVGREGGCGRSNACHAADMKDAASAYSWLRSRGYIAGKDSVLVSPHNSCLRWFGGNMPPHGTSNDEAVVDLTAWVAAGAAEE